MTALDREISAVEADYDRARVQRGERLPGLANAELDQWIRRLVDRLYELYEQREWLRASVISREDALPAVGLEVAE